MGNKTSKEQNKEQLANILAEIEEKTRALMCIPGVIRFSCSNYSETHELHISGREFPKLFSFEEVSFRKLSWHEQRGFNYEVSTKIGNVQICGVLTEQEYEKYCNQSQSADQVTA